ncbi:hypothetical protein GCM10011338_14500 [Alteromonas lipolytica]|nr:hypothetical protein GCM10011338_14500 [Alteromonas lipolytica]
MISNTLLKQDQELTFKTPMREFTDLLNEKLAYNVFALRSTVQFFRSSETVDKYEYDSFVRLVMEQSQNIAVMAYFKFHKIYPRSFGEGDLVPVYWSRFDESKGMFAEVVLPLVMDNLRQNISRIPGDAVATNIFTIGNDGKYYSFVLQRIGRDNGFLGILVDVSYALEQILNNRIAQNYALFETDTIPPRKAFSSADYIESQHNYMRNASFDDSLFFFDRQWQLYSYQKTPPQKILMYAAIPITGFFLGILLVYFVWFAIRLKVINHEKETALSHLHFAQEKIIEAEKLSAMGLVVAGVAHEVNTPLGISITSLSHLEEMVDELRKDFEQGKLDSDSFADFLSSITELAELSLNNIRKASDLVSKFKKIDVLNNGFTQELEPVNIAGVLEAFVERFYCEHPDSIVKFNINVDASLTVVTYPAAILEIFSYLASNAVAHAFDYEQQHCEIAIDYPLPGTAHRFQFKDNGTQFDKSLLHRVLDPFFTTKRGAGYAGLGLSVVYNLVTNKLHSDIQIEHDEGFCVAFDLKDLQ